MPFDPQRDFDIWWAFTTKKQVDYATVRADADLTLRTPFTEVQFAEITQRKRTDGQQFGKGHEFSTRQDSVSQDLRLARAFDCSSLMIGQAGAFTMGKVATSGVGPYTHVITLSDPPTDGKEAPVTTIYEHLSDGIERKIHSVGFDSYTVSGRNQEVVQLQAALIGSGQVTNAALTGGAPALTPVSIFNGGDTIVSVGPQGAPVDISERILDWSFTVNQQLKADLGYHPGSGLYRARIWLGQRRVSLSIRAFIDDTSDLLDLFLQDTLREVTIDNTIDANNRFTAKFPGVRFNDYGTVVEDGMLVHNLGSGDDGIFKDVGGTPNEPIELTVINDEATYLATV